MTAQAPDMLAYNGTRYSIIGRSGGPLFTPQRYGLKPVSPNTANYRGFKAKFKVHNNSLFLDALQVYTSADHEPLIGNIAPVASQMALQYSDMNFAIPYDGIIRIAKGFIDEFYIHMGYQKPSAFKTVIDLSFTGGQLVEAKDRSAEAETIRGKFKEQYESGDPFSSVEKAFSLDMEFV